jgi:hypothetical protein
MALQVYYKLTSACLALALLQVLYVPPWPYTIGTLHLHPGHWYVLPQIDTYHAMYQKLVCQCTVGQGQVITTITMACKMLITVCTMVYTKKTGIDHVLYYGETTDPGS